MKWLRKIKIVILIYSVSVKNLCVLFLFYVDKRDIKKYNKTIGDISVITYYKSHRE